MKDKTKDTFVAITNLIFFCKWCLRYISNVLRVGALSMVFCALENFHIIFCFWFRYAYSVQVISLPHFHKGTLFLV